MHDEAVWEWSSEGDAALDDEWMMFAEELPCLLDMRVTRTAGRRLAFLPGVVALGPAV